MMDKIENILWVAFAAGLFVSNSLTYVLFFLLFLIWLGTRAGQDLRQRPEAVTMLLGAFMLWRVLSAFTSLSFRDSLAVLPPLGLFCMLTMARDRFQGIGGRGLARKIVLGMAVTASAASLWAMAGYFRDLPEHAVGFYGGYSLFATLLAMDLVLMTSAILTETDPRIRAFLIVSAGLQAVALVLTNQRGPWLGALLGVLTAGALSGRKRFWVWAAGMLVLVLGVVWAGGAGERVFAKMGDLVRLHDSGRGVLWSAALREIPRHPVLGSGPNTFRLICGDDILKMNDPGVSGCHNEFLQIPFESGLPALALYLGFWGMLATMAVRRFRRSRGASRTLAGGTLGVLAAYLLMSFFGTGGSDMAVLYMMMVAGKAVQR